MLDGVFSTHRILHHAHHFRAAAASDTLQRSACSLWPMEAPPDLTMYSRYARVRVSGFARSWNNLSAIPKTSWLHKAIHGTKRGLQELGAEPKFVEPSTAGWRGPNWLTGFVSIAFPPMKRLYRDHQRRRGPASGGDLQPSLACLTRGGSDVSVKGTTQAI
jgi:hypothetical protein